MSRTVQQLFDLHGKTALVTGGSRGLGLQLAEALGEAGARVLLTSRKLSDLQEAAAHLRERGIEADVIAADCADPADIERLAQEAMKRLGLDMLDYMWERGWDCEYGGILYFSDLFGKPIQE